MIGIDIGGANLKLAHQDGATRAVPFPLWKQPDDLAGALGQLLRELPNAAALAVTMTGELADCYNSKADGVCRILDAVECVADGRPVHVWQTGAEFFTAELAREFPILVAAANWHALATHLGRVVPDQFALLVDVGSTTTDIVPLLDGLPSTIGLTDTTRLQNRELYYTGVVRTPVCSLVQAVPLDDDVFSIAAELFATTADVYRVLGEIECDHTSNDTADGKPATAANSYHRLARMLCADVDEIGQDAIDRMARFLADVQQQRIGQCITSVTSRVRNEFGLQDGPTTVIVSGSGSWLARRSVEAALGQFAPEIIVLDEMLTPQLAESACAWAVCKLARERT